MPVAAVPRYIPSKLLGEASPGLRFNMYLPLWEEGHWTRARATRPALDNATRLTQDDQKRNRALCERQAALAMSLAVAGTLLRLEGRSVAPFTTGLGNSHPMENGFSFLDPYGLPYLPGSSVKGVVRAAARELEWSPHLLQLLLGHDPGEQEDFMRGALTFWDVFPEIRGDRLLVELMTPHQSHYYAGSSNQRGASDSPHDSGDPNPIFFMSVPPESLFSFHISYDSSRISGLARSDDRGIDPVLQGAARQLIDQPSLWKELLSAAFDHAFQWMGFGAKTSVGYGAMMRDRENEARTEAKAQQARELQTAELARKGKSAAQLEVLDYQDWCERQIKSRQGRKTKVGEEPFQRSQKLANAAATADWTNDEKAAALAAIEHWATLLIAIDLKDLRKRLNLSRLRDSV